MCRGAESSYGRKASSANNGIGGRVSKERLSTGSDREWRAETTSPPEISDAGKDE